MPTEHLIAYFKEERADFYIDEDTFSRCYEYGKRNYGRYGGEKLILILILSLLANILDDRLLPIRFPF